MSKVTKPYTKDLPAAVICPFCGSDDSEPLAAFGSLLMTSQYYCNACNTTFEWVRREHELPRPNAH
jgi:hypothetical protein